MNAHVVHLFLWGRLGLGVVQMMLMMRTAFWHLGQIRPGVVQMMLIMRTSFWLLCQNKPRVVQTVLMMRTSFWHLGHIRPRVVQMMLMMCLPCSLGQLGPGAGANLCVAFVVCTTLGLILLRCQTVHTMSIICTTLDLIIWPRCQKDVRIMSII